MSRKNPKKLRRKQQAGHSQGGGQDDGQDGGQEEKGFRDSWEFRSGKFALRAAAFFIFLGYLGITGASTVSWAQLKWVRAQSLERLPSLADHYLNKVFKPEKLNKWVSMRRREETEDIIRILLPYTGRLPTFTFFYYSLQLKELGKIEDSLFWWQFSRFRARFDALRCGSVMAVENLGSLIEHIPHPEFPPDTERDSKEVIESLLSVLELDAHYPAENLPEELCTPLRAMEPGKFKSVEVARWRAIRFTLRKMTEYNVERMLTEVTQELKPRLPPTAAIPETDKPVDVAALVKGKPHPARIISSSSYSALLLCGLGQGVVFLLLLAADRRREEEETDPKAADTGADKGEKPEDGGQ